MKKSTELIDLEKILVYNWDGDSKIIGAPNPIFMKYYDLFKEVYRLKLFSSQCKSNNGFVHLMDWLKENKLVFEGGMIFRDHGTKESKELLTGLTTIQCHLN